MDPFTLAFALCIAWGAAGAVDHALDGLLSANVGGGARGVRRHVRSAGMKRLRRVQARARAGMQRRPLGRAALWAAQETGNVRRAWAKGRKKALKARQKRRGNDPLPVQRWVRTLGNLTGLSPDRPPQGQPDPGPVVDPDDPKVVPGEVVEPGPEGQPQGQPEPVAQTEGQPQGQPTAPGPARPTAVIIVGKSSSHCSRCAAPALPEWSECKTCQALFTGVMSVYGQYLPAVEKMRPDLPLVDQAPPPEDIWQDPPVAGTICEAVNAYDPDDGQGVAEAVTESQATTPRCTYCGRRRPGWITRNGNVACPGCVRHLPDGPKPWTPPEHRCLAMVEGEFPKLFTNRYGSTDVVGRETRTVRCGNEAIVGGIYCQEHQHAPGPLTGGGCRGIVPVDTPGRQWLIRGGLRAEDDPLVDAPCPNQAGPDGYCDEHRQAPAGEHPKCPDCGSPEVLGEGPHRLANGECPVPPAERTPPAPQVDADGAVKEQEEHDPAGATTTPAPTEGTTPMPTTDITNAPAAVEAWDNAGKSAEGTASAMDQLHKQVATTADAMGDFEVGGETDTVKAGDVAITAYATAQAALTTHRSKVHDQFDGSIDAAAGHQPAAHSPMQPA